MAELVKCYRCGVLFDPTDFILDAPCADCQLDFPDNFLRIDVVRAREEERINVLVERFYALRMSDSEIGAAIGVGRTVVATRRTKLGLPAHTFMGDEKWRDPEKVRSDLAERMQGNTYRVGKKANIAGIKAQRGL
jgi:hypothetical protein